MSDGEQTLRTKLNGETARIRWHELKRHYASGAMITVAPDLDLVDVAVHVAMNDAELVRRWLQQDRMRRTTGEEARAWSDQDRELWGVVVAPWVLVQEA